LIREWDLSCFGRWVLTRQLQSGKKSWVFDLKDYRDAHTDERVKPVDHGGKGGGDTTAGLISTKTIKKHLYLRISSMPRQPLLLEEEPESTPDQRGFRSSSPQLNSSSPFYCTNLPALCPSFNFATPSRIQIVGYTSGFLFTLGWWLFIGILQN
jgi:hypothetical protein